MKREPFLLNKIKECNLNERRMSFFTSEEY